MELQKDWKKLSFYIESSLITMPPKQKQDNTTTEMPKCDRKKEKDQTNEPLANIIVSKRGRKKKEDTNLKPWPQKEGRTFTHTADN